VGSDCAVALAAAGVQRGIIANRVCRESAVHVWWLVDRTLGWIGGRSRGGFAANVTGRCGNGDDASQSHDAALD